MKKDHVEYLEAIGITEKFLARVEAVLAQYEKLHGPVEDALLFVSHFFDKESVCHYEGLWLFLPGIMMEAKDFLDKDDLDFAAVPHIAYLRTTKKDYDFEVNPTPASRLTVSFHAESGVGGTLKAANRNCPYLYRILVDYLVPLVRPGQ